MQHNMCCRILLWTNHHAEWNGKIWQKIFNFMAKSGILALCHILPFQISPVPIPPPPQDVLPPPRIGAAYVCATLRPTPPLSAVDQAEETALE